MSSTDATIQTGLRRLLALFAAVSMILSIMAIGAGPALGDEPAPGPDTITVDGVTYDATQKSGPVSHFETPDTNPEEAFTSRNVWEGHGSEHLPCEDGIHWVDNTEVLTISNCLEGEGEPEPDTALADVSVTGACDEEGNFVLTVLSANASVDVDLNANGSIEGANEVDVADGDHVIEASGEIDWEATADADAAFSGDVTVKTGTVVILDCEEEDVDAELALLVEKSATQNEVSLNATTSATSNEAIVFMVTITNSSSEEIEITSLEDDVFGTLSGDADCQVETHLAADASCSFTFEKTLNVDLSESQLVALVETPSHTNVVTVMGVDVETSANVMGEAALTFPVVLTDVLGISFTAPTTTTPAAGPVTPVDAAAGAVGDEVLAAQVEAEQLPFTGIESDRLLGLAILLLGGGLLLLRVTPGREES